MGNQLAGIAPSQILPVEYYLTDVPDYNYECSLGSTRFFKVARAKYREGLVVVKVFVIHDPSLPLKSHRDRIDLIKTRLHGATNCLPFQRATLSDRAALLFRQYVKDSLYDRISTRPFLSLVEKKWIAFQLLCALNQSHKSQVYHGDIKSENVMVTSWSWLLLTDFGSFKPTYLPADNPADFSYYFDTSRRRTCYIAPERFVDGAGRNFPEQSGTYSGDTMYDERSGNELTAAMDIFSAGCVITELFTEGHAPFDLSQLLAYCVGEHSPWKVLDKIDDPDVKELVRHMMQKEPSLRLSAEEYLIQQRGKAFPEYFYSYLKLYLQRFASFPILPPDDKILRIRKDFTEILRNLQADDTNISDTSGLVLIISLITSCSRSLRYCHTKLVALELMLQLSKYLPSDLVMDRLLPFMLFFVNDSFPRVRAEALRTVTDCLSNVKAVSKSDANIFPEYILPNLSPLTLDGAVVVRVTYAENIAVLAETALRFLEIVQLESTAKKHKDSTVGVNYQPTSYDVELQALHEMIQQKVVILLCDADNIVKRTLLESGITRLCVFFGRQKASDVLLSHMITFLNDKNDWQLRGSFYDSIVGVAAYVGWQSTNILKPLLQQGLNDHEEFVVQKAICAVTAMTELGLIQKVVTRELLAEVVKFLCHPGPYVRHAAVGYIATLARTLNIADVHCYLLPHVVPFLAQTNIHQLDSEVVLLNALSSPIDRSIYDYVLRSPHMDRLMESMQDRQLIRNICRPGQKPAYAETDDTISQLFRKLTSQGLSERDEDKLLAMKDFMTKLNRYRASSVESSSSFEQEYWVNQGLVLVHSFDNSLTLRHADLISDHKSDIGTQQAARKQTKRKTGDQQQGQLSPSLMNEEWKSMFGSAEDGIHSRSKEGSPQPPSQPAGGSGTESDISQGPSPPRANEAVIGAPRKAPVPAVPEKPKIHYHYSDCRLGLKVLVDKKRRDYERDVMARELLSDGALWDHERQMALPWRPKGLLVAHLHEHKGAINRLAVNHDHTLFATCSNDGATKLWDCSRMEKTSTSRSKVTYTKQGGQIRSLTFCDNEKTLATVSDNKSIHITSLETNANIAPAKMNLHLNQCLEVNDKGLVIDLQHFDAGSQHILVYATVHGYLIGWDIRANEAAWTLQNKLSHGLTTSFSVHHQQNWLALGTSGGVFVCWDMRFQLPITTVTHPTGARVRRLLCHPLHQSWIVASLQGNNEVSMWDLETGARQQTLWASTAPTLSTTQASSHSVNGLWFGHTDAHNYLITTGSDMRIRYWDLTTPQNSYIVCGAASDPTNQTLVSYRSRMIEGTDVLQEMYTKQRLTPAQEDAPRRGPDLPPAGHHDIITDVNVCHNNQSFLVTSSRDGVLKIWK